MSVSGFTVNALDLVIIKLRWGENFIMKLTHNNSRENYNIRLRSTGERMFKCNQIHCIGKRFHFFYLDSKQNKVIIRLLRKA